MRWAVLLAALILSSGVQAQLEKRDVHIAVGGKAAV
jgi:hypothetical protein